MGTGGRVNSLLSHCGVFLYLLLEDIGQGRTVSGVNELNDFVYAPLQRVSLQHQRDLLLHLAHKGQVQILHDTLANICLTDHSMYPVQLVLNVQQRIHCINNKHFTAHLLTANR